MALGIIFFVLLATAVVEAKISVFPNTSFRTGDEKLTILCEVLSQDRFDTLYNIQLERDTVALGFIDGRGPKLISPNTSSKYQLTGEFRAFSPSRSFLQLVINKPSPEDQGTYRCSSIGVLSTGLTDTQRQNVTIKESPVSTSTASTSTSATSTSTSATSTSTGTASTSTSATSTSTSATSTSTGTVSTSTSASSTRPVTANAVSYGCVIQIFTLTLYSILK
ncbi:hypothetical protein SNE40_016238 [Patella caerulea]|uniref:Ig-like domain-containing protein n=1 Tax=Patella caerulea TaxID=87958 RepID=A0AAN8PN42_PATCE